MDTNQPSETAAPDQSQPDPSQPDPSQLDPSQPVLSQPVPSVTGPGKPGNKTALIIIAIVAGVVLLCCAVILCIASIFMVTRKTSSGPVKPDHYGVFLNKGGKLTELEENEFFGVPDAHELGNLETISDKRPTILVWRRETQLQYLQFFDIDSKDELTYNAAPQEDGVIEIQPRKDLGKGIYCLIQGNPVATGLAGWCFKVK